VAGSRAGSLEPHIPRELLSIFSMTDSAGKRSVVGRAIVRMES
jgi:hypothetical protein